MPYRNDIAAGKLVSRDTAKNALGANVDGYVLPMFHSQIAFAYNPDLVKAPPKTFAELSEWVKKNPKQFGYNGVKGGMSGVGFVMGWVAANSGMGDKLEKGPYDPAAKATIEKSLASLKDFNQYVVMTPGNAGTLDMLNRGEIAMGPVWVDMFYTWMADGKMNPKVKLALPSPGIARPADVLRDSGQGRERRDGEEVHRLRREPRSAGRRHRQAVQLVSGHRSAARAGEARRRPRGTSSSPTSRRPICRRTAGRSRCREYFTDIVEGYERVVLK